MEIVADVDRHQLLVGDTAPDDGLIIAPGDWWKTLRRRVIQSDGSLLVPSDSRLTTPAGICKARNVLETIHDPK
jgi:hypothetical protein